MKIDIQVLRKREEIRHRSNLDWAEAHSWLQETKNKLDKPYDSIAIQIYETVFTTKGNLEAMPWDSVEDLLDFEVAHNWLELKEKIAAAGAK